MPSSTSTTWTGAAGNGLWSDPANWSNGTPPAGAPFSSPDQDLATIDNSVETALFTVVIAGPEAGGEVVVNAADPSGSVAVSLTGTLDLTSAGAALGLLSLQKGTFEIDGGSLDDAEVVESGGVLTFGPGTDSLSSSFIDGAVTIGAGAEVVITPSSFAVFEGAGGYGAPVTDVVNGGTLSVLGGGLYLDGEIDIKNGTVSLDGGGVQSYGGAASLFADGGALTVTQNTGVNGDVTVEGGLSLTGAQTVSVTSGSTLALGSASLGSVTTVNLDGGTLDVSGTLNLADAVVENGTLILESGSTYSLGANASLSNVSLTDDRPAGQTNWTGAAGDGLWTTAANWTNGVPLAGTNLTADGQSAAVINNGLDATPFTVTISGTQSAQDVTVDATDPSGGPSVSLTGGLDLTWGGASPAFGTLELQAGTFEVDGGTIAGAGVNLDGGNLTFGDQTTYGQSTLNGDIIDGAFTIGDDSLLVLSGEDVFHGGASSGFAATDVTLNGGADLIVGTGGRLDLNGELDIQNGLFALDGGNLEGFGGGAATVFLDGGSFFVAQNTTLSNAVNIYGGFFEFDNTGVTATIDASGVTTLGQASGAQTVLDLNGGTLDVFGALDLVNTEVENGNITVEGGATFSQDQASSLSGVTVTGEATTATNWTGGGDGSSWSDPNNWDNGVPLAGGPYLSLANDVTTIDNAHGDANPFTVDITGAQAGAEVIVNAADPASGVAVSLQGTLDLAYHATGGGASLGLLDLQSGTFEVDGGTLQALNVRQDGGQITFGAVATWGAATLDASGIAGDFDIGNASDLVIAQNSFGAFNEADPPTIDTVTIDGASTLDIKGSLSTGNNIDIVSGTVILDGGSLSTSNGARVIEEGGGFTVQGNGTLDNATIDGNFTIGSVDTLSVAAGDTALLESNGGSIPVTIAAFGTIDVTGTLDVLGEITGYGGNLVLETGATLKDATVDGQGDYSYAPSVQVNGAATLDNVTVDAPLSLGDGPLVLTIAGVTNFGEAGDASPMQVDLNGDELDVTGTLNLINTQITDGSIVLESGATLTTDSASTLDGVTVEQTLPNGDLELTGQDVVVQSLQTVTAAQDVEVITGLTANGTASGAPGQVTFADTGSAGFAGAGTVTVTDGNGPSSTNFSGATLDADVAGQTLLIDTAGYDADYGSYAAENGGTLEIGDAANAASNLATGVLTAGLSATGGSTIAFFGAGGISTVIGQITLESTSAIEVLTPSGTISLARSLTSVGSYDPLTYQGRQGILNLEGGASFTDPNALTLYGQINLTGGTVSAASFSGNEVFAGGTVGIDSPSGVEGFGTVQGAFGSADGGAALQASGGTLTYDGTLYGYVNLIADANSTLIVNSPLSTAPDVNGDLTNGYVIDLATGSKIDLAGLITDASNIYTTFTGTGATLTLADPHDLTFNINLNGNDQTGDAIDLAGLTAKLLADGKPDVVITRPNPSMAQVIINPVDDPGHDVTFDFTGSIASTGLSFKADDGNGGSEIVFGPGPDAAVPIVEPGAAMQVEPGGAYQFTQNVHVGYPGSDDPGPLQDSIIIINQDQHNPNQDTLSGSILGATGYGITASGFFSGLTPGSSSADLGGAIVVGDGTPINFLVDTSSGGLKTSTVTLGFTSDSDTPGGSATSLLPNKTVTVQAGIYRYAQLGVPTDVFHVQATADTQYKTLYLPIKNTAIADGYSEGLIATVTGSSGDFTGNGAPSDPAGATGLIAAGATDSSGISFQADTNPDDFAGGRDYTQTGTINLGLTSDGTGTSALGQTKLPAAAVQVEVEFYDLAKAFVETPQVFSVHATDGAGPQFTTEYLSVENIAAADGFSESLDATITGSTGDFTGQSGAADPAGTASLIAAGDTNDDELAFQVETNVNDLPNGRDTVQTGDITLTLWSDGTSTSGFGKTSLGTITVPVTVDLDPLAKPAFTTVYDVHATDPLSLTDTTTLALDTSNIANPGADDLVSTITGATGDFTTAGSPYIVTNPAGTTDPIAPGGTDSRSLQFDVVTNADLVENDDLETQTGTFTISSVSDPELSNDPDAEVTDLPAKTVNVAVNVMGYAHPIIEGVDDAPDNEYDPTVGPTKTKTINLGAVLQGESGFHPFVFTNAAPANSDFLDVTPPNGYQTVDLFGLAPGETFAGDEADNGGLGYGGAVGAHSVTFQFDPSSSDVSSNTPLTPVDVTYTWTVVPIPQVATAWGDVHITTFAGTSYNFQAAGEFILAQSTLPGNSFQVQIRLEPFYPGASVSVIKQLAAEIGADRVTIDPSRTAPVWLNGAAVSLSAANPVLQLAGGEVELIDNRDYEVVWNTGEVMNVGNGGTYLSVSTLSPGPGDVAGSFKGLLGSGDGPANDFQLADGTVVPHANGVTAADLYGEFANAWRVTQQNSLLDYGSGQTTATFTDLNFPADATELANLPASVVAAAQAAVAAAGITNPTVADEAALDLIVTGDPTFLVGAQNVQQAGGGGIETSITQATPPPAIGVTAAAASLTEATGTNTTSVGFNVYLTAASATDTVIDYAVTAPDASYLGAGAFGGLLPTGSLTIAAGDTTGTVTITAPANVLGTLPSAKLEIALTSPAGDQVVAPTAQTLIVNSAPEPGVAPVPALAELTPLGVATAGVNTVSVDLGVFVQGVAAPAARFSVGNNAASSADSLSGAIADGGSAGFDVGGANAIGVLTPGTAYQGLFISPNTSTVGAYSDTLTYNPTDVNATGYSKALTAQTITVTGSVIAAAIPQLATTTPIDFGEAHQGATVGATLSIANTAAAGAASLDVTPILINGAATVSGSINQLAAGGSDASSISIGLNTQNAGAESGIIQLDYASDTGTGRTYSAGNPQITLSGAVYREASAQITAPATVIVHTGDDGGSLAQTLTIADTAASDGYSEGLRASVTGFAGDVTAATGSTGLIAAGASDSQSLTANLSTLASGMRIGTVTLDLISDGAGVDTLGQTDLGPTTAQLSVQVDNYAAAALEKTSGVGAFDGSAATGYTLDLGTLLQGSGPVTVGLGVVNAASGLADLLTGDFTATGDGAFQNTLGAITTGLGAGKADTAPTVTLSTTNTGVFTETVTLHSTGSNAGGYSGALADETLTVTGTVTPAQLHWSNQVSGGFGQSGDWSPTQAPGALNNAILDAPGSSAYVVTASTSQSVASIQTAATATLSITGGVFAAAGGTGAGANAGVISAVNGSTLELGDSGADTIANTGLILAGLHGAVTITGAVVNTGHLAVNGGSLTVVGAVSGSGYGEVIAGTFDFTGAFNESVVFTSGSTGTLELGDSVAYAQGRIQGLSAVGANGLDLGDINFVSGTTTATFGGTATSGVLTVTDGTHTAKINLIGDYLNSTFTTSAGAGGVGTRIIDTRPISWTHQVSGSFATAADWTGGVAPGAANDAILEAAGSTAYVVIAGASETVASVQTASTARLAITGGVFTITNGTGAGSNVGRVTVTQNGTLDIGGVFANPGLILAENNGAIQVAAGGLTLTGSGSLYLADNTLDGATAGATLTTSNFIYGAGQLGGGRMILVNQAAGIIESYGSSPLTVDTGANTITNAGLILATSAGGMTIDSAVANTGHFAVNGGSMTVMGAVTGSGYGEVVSGTLDFAGTFNENVVFTAGSTGTLELADSVAYAKGRIQGLSTTGTNALDLADITFTSGVTTATFSGSSTSGVLTVTDGTHTANINLIGDYVGHTFTTSPGAGGVGTRIVDPSPAALLAPTPSALPAPPHGFIAAMAALGAQTGAAHGWMPDPQQSARPTLMLPRAA